MAEYTSGSIHFTGLGNGTDFDTMITQLKSIEEIPAKRLLKWKADWQERLEAFQTLRTELVNLRATAMKMNSVETFLVKTAESSNSVVASATAKSNAQAGVYRLEVNQVATNSIWSMDTGFADTNAVVNSSGQTQPFVYDYKGKTRTINVAAGTTLKGLENLINNDTNNPGVRVSLIKGAGGYTFQMRGMDLGAENSLHITQANLNGFGSANNTTYTTACKTGLASAADIVNNTGSPVTYTYSYNGVTRNLSVPAGASLQDFADLINNDGSNPGVTASLAAGNDGKQVLTLTGTSALGTAPITTTENLNLAGISNGFKSTGYEPYTAAYTTTFASATDIVNTGSTDITYKYAYNGQTRSITVPPNTTLQGLANLITADNAGVTASVATGSDGKQVLTLTGDPSKGGLPITAEKNTLLEGIKNLDLKSTYTPAAAPGSWHVQQSQNAKIRINGWPAGDYLETSSNTVDDVAEGMTFNLKDVGSTVITVTTDTEKIKENVVAFMDAVNAVRTTIINLTKYDETKEVKSPEYATSQFQMQKGSILTGNYGVQLLSSQLKQATAGTPLGFTALRKETIDGADFYIGDIFSSLSQLGIKTMADGSSGTPNFGLLVLNTDTDLPTLDSVLAASPEAVAEFFAAKNLGVSDSPNFSFASQVESMTKPGIYDVKYTIGSDGIPVGTINGKEAKYDPVTGEFGISSWPPESDNPGAVTATSDGSADSEYTIAVSQLAKSASASANTTLTDPSKPANTSAVDQAFKYTYDGTEHTVTLKPGESLNDLAARINYSKTNPGVTAKVVKQSDGTYGFTIEGATGTKADGTTPHTMDATITTDIGAFGSNTWTVNAASQDAKYTITKGSTTTAKTSKSNTVSNAAPGMVFSLHSVGTATITSKAYNSADGLYIHPDNLTQGSYSGTVRIKQGKINELLTMLDGPKGKPEEGMLGINGALGILDRNYKDIIKNIDTKIEREDNRIIKWERLTRLRFSRLEATLNRYDNLNKAVESQIKQLSTSSS